jgi:Pyruvate/2-oxoacid:ferredoxin oxidoreductase delta subunit
MTEIDYYELVRRNLELGPIYAPKHKKVIQLMKVFWDGEEIKILSHFSKVGKFISTKQLSEKTGYPKDKIKKILARSVRNGTVANKGSRYSLIPLLPGIFEKYFIVRKDTEENQKKAAKLYRDLMKEVMPPSTVASKGQHVFRPLLPYDAKEKLIEINKTLEYESQALPYELVKDMIDKNEHFAVIPCQCRLIGELTGEPCKCAPAEMGCFLVGIAAQMIPQMCDEARVMTKKEAIQFLKDTEKAGLVHNTASGSSENSMFICNCCSCHCGALYPARLMHVKGSSQSNYQPIIDMNLCVKCETCMRKCPGEAIYHKWPKESDSSDEQMVVREELCIGCGICAINCPKDAIKMIKVRENVPKTAPKIGNVSFGELITM